jgi:hypothetical protein
MPSFATVFSLAFCALAVDAKDSARLVRKSVNSDGTVMSASSQTDQFEEPQMGSKVQDVLREMEDLARSGNTPEPEKIKTIKSIVADELLPDLQATHDSAAKQVGINLAAIDTCNTNALARLQEIKRSTEVSVGKERTDHADCREEEKNKESNKDDKCKELDDFLNGINVPADLPAGRPRDQMVQYVKTMSQYFCPKGPTVTTLDEACTAALTEHAKHKAACDRLQATFELGFCTWRTELTDACSALSACYVSAKKVYSDHMSDTKELVRKWKVEYGALKKILCYVEVWLSDNDVKTADKDQLAKCESSSIDTSPMDIDFGKPADQAQCPLTAVETYPGTAGFVTTEYVNFKEYVNDVIPCLSVK